MSWGEAGKCILRALRKSGESWLYSGLFPPHPILAPPDPVQTKLSAQAPPLPPLPSPPQASGTLWASLEFPQPSGASTVFNPISQMRPREGKQPAQSHTALTAYPLCVLGDSSLEFRVDTQRNKESIAL